MKYLLLSLFVIASAQAQDFCEQLTPIQESVRTCEEQLSNASAEVRRVDEISRENERLISGARATQERAQRLNACTTQNEKLQQALAATDAAIDEGRASVGVLRGKREELVRFVKDNWKSSYECVAIDPKYGNAPDEAGEPRVYFASGRTQDEAKAALRAAAARRGNTSWDRLREAHRCFEIPDQENAQRIDRDVKALGEEANAVRFGATRG